MTWFNVEAEDYLTRGDPHAGLDGRLRTYLRSQGIDPAEYPMAYLVTAPRFLGYSFNPVSFWYLYDEGKQLKAMILEVNNTFDERRMYFLGQAPEPDRIPASSPQQTISKGDVGPAHDHAFEMSPGKLRASWPKDFHVSPFNSRDGTYSLVASDPSFPDTDGQGPVRNHITLRSPQGPVTLVASVFSEGPSLDPSNMTIWGSLRFVAMWWWVGLMTFPRIVREAGKLFLKRRLGMRVYWRPEVRLNSIAREETLSERTLEMFFRNFLEHKVAGLDIPIVVNYKAALRNHPRTETFSSPSVPSHPEDTEVVDVVVLTPVFYGRFVHYAHMMEAFSMEMLCPEEENKTVSVSNPELLPKIFAGSSDSQIGKYHGTQTLSGLLGTLRWMCLRALRTHPPPPSYLATIRQASGPPKNDIRSFPFAPIDKFVDEKCNAEEARAYRAAVTELFLSNRFALGDPGILQAYDFVLRIILLYIAARHVACHPSSVTGQMLTSGLRGFIDPAIMFCIYNGANIWASLKAAVLEGRS
ncbi:MAG: hypothetical protein M1832_006366 [Thelocarpon impressellum]|nr:MAG: hypothetical protein M1832_006366 [Thelocarpon impressellum]